MTTIDQGPGEFAGKRALVTGGTRGIGEAIVRALADAGAKVLTTARSEPAEVPEGVTFVAADVRTRDGAETLAAAARETFGGVDFLVHNAGGDKPYGSALTIPDEVWVNSLNLNFLASVRLDSLLAPGMREQGSGAIVHVSSAGTPTSFPVVLHYTAAKAALQNYSRGLALELAPAGIRVNVVSPGRTITPGGLATREQWNELEEGVKDETKPPLGRDGTPEDVAESVLFLLSERSSWVTAAHLVVDGGEFPR
jgi:NAD(P)-dependent dehydrogenase (short-subunit alcohol dehydrogenase family)